MDKARFQKLKKQLKLPEDYSYEQYNDHMKKIAQIESSGGKFLNHALQTSGMHKGTRAQGPLALMPVVGLDELKAMNDGRYEKYKHMSGPEFEQVLKADPNLVQELAEHYDMRAIARAKGDPIVAAYKHNRGLSANPAKLVTDKDYVTKFKRLSGLVPKATVAQASREEMQAAQAPMEPKRQDLNSDIEPVQRPEPQSMNTTELPDVSTDMDDSNQFKREKLQKLMALLSDDTEDTDEDEIA